MDLQTGLVYGPVRSRRLGTSLGVNLSPPGRKTCNFNCAYCQYGWTDFPVRGAFPPPADVIDAVDRALAANPDVDTITVAGNGEPTLHPGFAPIAEGLFHVRARRAPAGEAGAAVQRFDAGPRRREEQPLPVRHAVHETGRRRRDDLPPRQRAGIPLARLIADLRSVGHI